MKILIIEDEPKTAAFLKKGFSEEGDIADIAVNGVDGQHLAVTGNYDVIVLDVMLPQRD
ncbi:MAG: DNA-binding response regulator, partial [Acidithiobacillus ferrivorans]